VDKDSVAPVPFKYIGYSCGRIWRRARPAKRLVNHLTVGGPGVLAIDDLQWAEPTRQQWLMASD
jgi:hypothetical protein